MVAERDLVATYFTPSLSCPRQPQVAVEVARVVTQHAGPAIVVGVRLRVLTYNIRSGTEIFGRPRLNEQADVMRDMGPDLVLLQEVSSRPCVWRVW
jgi:hypothetical protein